MQRLLVAGTASLWVLTAGCGASRSGASGPGTTAGEGGSSGVAGAAARGGTDSTNGGTPASGGAMSNSAGGAPGAGRGGALSGAGAPGSGGSAGTAAGGATTGGVSGASGGAAGAPNAAGTQGTTAGAGGMRAHTTDVTVNLDEPLQTMDGFGVGDAFANALTDAEADELFDPQRGIGLSILRIAMSTSGDALSSGVWSDVQAAKARGVNTFIATTYSAPANCKSNANVNDGGHLNSDCYESWATQIAAFPALVKQKTGVDLYGMSPQQQPDFASCGTMAPCNGDFPSMLYTSDEMVTFVNVLGPKLHGLNPPVRLMGPDSAEWIHLWTNKSATGSSDPLKGVGYDYGHALFRDATAWGLMDTISTQQYDTQVAEPWPSDVPRTKPIWMTEMSGIKFWPEQGPSDDIANGVVVAGWIHDAIVNGPASAWLYFWHQALNTDDNEGLLLKDGRMTKRFYTFGNFSRFVRPGYTRVSVTGNVPDGVLLTSYQGSDGTVVVVAINKNSTPVSLPIFVLGGRAPASFAPYLTSATDNLAARVPLDLSENAFMATLDGLSVTSFVGAP